MTAMMEAPCKNVSSLYQAEDMDILERVKAIKSRWSRKEKAVRAEVGRRRRAVLAALVESAIVENQSECAAY